MRGIIWYHFILLRLMLSTLSSQIGPFIESPQADVFTCWYFLSGCLPQWDKTDRTCSNMCFENIEFMSTLNAETTADILMHWHGDIFFKAIIIWHSSCSFADLYTDDMICTYERWFFALVGHKLSQATLKIQLRWCIWVGEWLRQGLTGLGLECEESNQENRDTVLICTSQIWMLLALETVDEYFQKWLGKPERMLPANGVAPWILDPEILPFQGPDFTTRHSVHWALCKVCAGLFWVLVLYAYMHYIVLFFVNDFESFVCMDFSCILKWIVDWMDWMNV